MPAQRRAWIRYSRLENSSVVARPVHDLSNLADRRIIEGKMRARTRERRWRLLTFVGGTLYALFLVIAPFEHHDVACHFKTPQHCTSCSFSLVGADPDAPAIVGAFHLSDAGSVVGVQLIVDAVLLAASSTGRSPPASA